MTTATIVSTIFSVSPLRREIIVLIPDTHESLDVEVALLAVRASIQFGGIVTKRVMAVTHRCLINEVVEVVVALCSVIGIQ